MTTRFKKAKIMVVLMEAEVVGKIADLYREWEISDATQHNWKVQLRAMNVSDAQRQKTLEG